MNIYKQGEDLTFQIIIKDDTNNAVDITSLSGLIILLYGKKNGSILNKYSLDTIEGYDGITVVSEIEGKVKFIVGHDKTKLAELDEYIIEIKIQQDDADYPEGKKHITKKGVFGKFVESKTKSITDL
jgi:hypothetical protein